MGEGERPGRPRGSVVAMFAWPMALADRCERSACRAVPAQGPIGGFTPKGISLRGCVSGSLLWRSPPAARVGNGQDLSANETRRAPIVRARPTHGPSSPHGPAQVGGVRALPCGSTASDAVAGVVALDPRRGFCDRGGSGRGRAELNGVRARFVPVTRWRGCRVLPWADASPGRSPPLQPS